jgi:hypothetical protein
MGLGELWLRLVGDSAPLCNISRGGGLWIIVATGNTLRLQLPRARLGGYDFRGEAHLKVAVAINLLRNGEPGCTLSGR